MPCYHPEPSDLDEALNRTCRLLAYVMQEAVGNPPDWVVEYSSKWGDDQNGERRLLDLATQILCKACTMMTEAERERVIYARTKPARDLANWWEDHQKFDNERDDE